MRNAGIAQGREHHRRARVGRAQRVDPLDTVDVHVAYLRRKLGKDLIRTVPGTGYLIPA